MISDFFMNGGLCPTKPTVFVGLRSPHPPSEAPPPVPRCFWIEFPTSLVTVWIRFAKIISPQLTVKYKIDHISQTKNRTKKLMKLKIRFDALRIFWNIFFYYWLVKTLENCEKKKSIITQKIKIAKIEKLIFYSFHNIVQCNNVYKKMETALFQGGGGRVCISLTKTGLNNCNHKQIILYFVI